MFAKLEPNFKSGSSSPTVSQQVKAVFSDPEIGLLTACCRQALHAGVSAHTGSLEDALQGSFDEQDLLELSKTHHLLLLVDRLAIRAHPERFSRGIADRFEGSAKRLAVSQLRLSAALIDIHREFKRDKIKHLFLKGPVLGQQVFGRDVLRYSGDLDVLVDPRDHARAHACLVRIGFRPKLNRWRALLGIPLRFTFRKDAAYLKAVPPMRLELHWRTDIVETLMVPGLFEQDDEIEFCHFHNESIPVLSDNLNCLFLCLHAAKHDWERLQWLLDIPLFIRARGLDPVRLLELADRYALRQAVEEALYLSETLLGVTWEKGDLGWPQGREDQLGRRLLRRFVWRMESDRGSLKSFVLAVERSRLYPGSLHRLHYMGYWFLNWILLRLGNKPVERP